MPLDIWHKCTELLQDELPSQQFNTWIRPLKVMGDDQDLCLLAPNRFVQDWVREKYLPRIEELLDELSGGEPPALALAVSSRRPKFGRKRSSNRASGSVQRTSSARKTPADLFGNVVNADVDKPSAATSRLTNPLSERLQHKAEPVEQPARENQFSSVHQGSVDKQPQVSLSANAQTAKAQSGFEFEEPASAPAGIQLTNSLAESRPPAAAESRSPVTAEPQLTQAKAEQPALNKGMLRGNLLMPEDLSAQGGQMPALQQQDSLKQQPQELMPADVSDIIQAHTSGKSDNVREYQNKQPLKNPLKAHSTIAEQRKPERQIDVEGGIKHNSALNNTFTFDSFVEGKSNQLALAAARQIAENPGAAYNPLFLYGGVGLGKTHLMHAVGNYLVKRDKNARVVYLHSERFVADMVKALQLNAINDFKRYYRSVDALLIDDIQFFAGKERSQEEFFHTFNALLEGGQQMILTCDRYPKEIKGLEERLKSRFGWGLTVAVEPPELETRVAILMKKAEQVKVDLPHDAAFFIAQRIRSNVRELEGALKRVVASAHFTGRPIDIGLIRESLKDLLALQDKQVSIDNIQRTVAEYYKIKISDILSKRRSRSVARPRQVAMALSKELTSHSLPEIGDAYGGRDHTTVLHACRKVKELIESDSEIREDYSNLQRLLTS